MTTNVGKGIVTHEIMDEIVTYSEALRFRFK